MIKETEKLIRVSEFPCLGFPSFSEVKFEIQIRREYSIGNQTIEDQAIEDQAIEDWYVANYRSGVQNGIKRTNIRGRN